MVMRRESKAARKKILVGALGIAMLAAPLAARAQVAVGIMVAPPAPRYEPMPPPRPGYVWAPGHWQWAGGRYAWDGGRWMEARPGYHWEPGRWDHQGRGWAYSEGRWMR
jgi:WXXGXW repeat (2 copies)